MQRFVAGSAANPALGIPSKIDGFERAMAQCKSRVVRREAPPWVEPATNRPIGNPPQTALVAWHTGVYLQ